MKKIKPLSDHVLVQRVESLSQKGGIFIPESAKEKPQEAKVIAVGPGKMDEGKRKCCIPLSFKNLYDSVKNNEAFSFELMMSDL